MCCVGSGCGSPAVSSCAAHTQLLYGTVVGTCQRHAYLVTTHEPTSHNRTPDSYTVSTAPYYYYHGIKVFVHRQYTRLTRTRLHVPTDFRNGTHNTARQKVRDTRPRGQGGVHTIIEPSYAVSGTVLLEHFLRPRRPASAVPLTFSLRRRSNHRRRAGSLPSEVVRVDHETARPNTQQHCVHLRRDGAMRRTNL